jgi:hypothetical protein
LFLAMSRRGKCVGAHAGSSLEVIPKTIAEHMPVQSIIIGQHAQPVYLYYRPVGPLMPNTGRYGEWTAVVGSQVVANFSIKILAEDRHAGLDHSRYLTGFRSISPIISSVRDY